MVALRATRNSPGCMTITTTKTTTITARAIRIILSIAIGSKVFTGADHCVLYFAALPLDGRSFVRWPRRHNVSRRRIPQGSRKACERSVWFCPVLDQCREFFQALRPTGIHAREHLRRARGDADGACL